MKNSKLKEEFEKVNESSGTSPHRYGPEAYRKDKKTICNKSLLWIGGAIGLLLILRHYQSGKSIKALLPLAGLIAGNWKCHEDTAQV
ncbi:hypothetical protein LZQ00_05545 [Sphingobacterium sp. SRCM116780]|uniref:hypothetical protein n=1 Tax=Sphingobacterium sp. SRCM116780 TaxID=2907623 RepID=UPI001F3355CF|nr:hypothetical protein [Sphingobacterium sp. SRCM116780]UIR57278.1 hypothetical protein LZQ00_05545 [Sphingobacterium sp. SRCM116780]